MARPTRKELAEAVISMSGKVSQKKLANQLASYLVRERRASELDAIMRETQSQRSIKHGVEEINVTSANILSDAAQKKLVGIMGGKKTIINQTIDKSVIGGVRVESSERMLDLTVRNRLQKLKQGVQK